MSELTPEELRRVRDAILMRERRVDDFLVVAPWQVPWAVAFVAWRRGFITAAERDARWRLLDRLRRAGAIPGPR